MPQKATQKRLCAYFKNLPRWPKARNHCGEPTVKMVEPARLKLMRSKKLTEPAAAAEEKYGIPVHNPLIFIKAVHDWDNITGNAMDRND